MNHRPASARADVAKARKQSKRQMQGGPRRDSTVRIAVESEMCGAAFPEPPALGVQPHSGLWPRAT